MIGLLISVLLTSLLVNGLQIATADGMLLSFIKKRLDAIFISRRSKKFCVNIDY